MNDDTFVTLKEATQKMNAGELTSETLVRDALERIEEANEDLNAMLWVSESVLYEAREIDKRRAQGEELGALAGIPFGIKDNILVQGWKSTAGSQILED